MDIYTWIIFKEPQGMSSHLHAWHQKMRKHLFNKICSIHMGYPVFGITTYQQHNSKIENVFSIAATISCISDMAGFRHIITYNWQPSYYQHCDSDLTTYVVLRPGKNAAVWFLGQMFCTLAYLALCALFDLLLPPICRQSVLSKFNPFFHYYYYYRCKKRKIIICVSK